MILALALLAACTADDETSYVQYNGEDDSVEIDVGAETRYVLDDTGVEVPEVATVTLTSSTGAVEIGVGTVDPSAGPVGTIHEVVVEVDEDYAAEIDRVSVRTDSADRGEDEFDLTADSAGEGFWVFELESVGEEGEERTDTFTFRLWQEEDTEE